MIETEKEMVEKATKTILKESVAGNMFYDCTFHEVPESASSFPLPQSAGPQFVDCKFVGYCEVE